MEHFFQGESDGSLSNQIDDILSQLSHLANAVLAQAAKLFSTTLEKLQHDFKGTLEGIEKQPLEAAQSFLEFCCFKALLQLTQENEFLHEPEFRHFSFDFMVAWETPLESEETRNVECRKPRANAKTEEDSSFFFSDLMPFMVEVEKTVGLMAFVRIAPCVSIIADAITVEPLFEILTASTSGRLPFGTYEKYIEALEMSLNNMREKNQRSFLKALHLSEEEHVIEIDGTSQFVVQHVDLKALPGRLTLTDHCLYFEPSSLVWHKDAIQYDLSSQVDHTVSKELSGPRGSRVFDKAIKYQTTSPEQQQIVFEFPDLMGSRRRDYWLAIMQEVIDTHKVIRKHKLESTCKMEALARSVLGVLRLQAVRDCVQLLISSPGALLAFNFSQNMLCGGDLVLDTLSDTLKNSIVEEMDLQSETESICLKQQSSLHWLESFNIWRPKQYDQSLFYEVKHGEPTPLELAVEKARQSSKYMQTAKIKEDEVKLDGIGTNITVMKEFLQPITLTYNWIKIILSWDKPLLSMIAFIVAAIIILRNWLGFIIPIFFASAGLFVIWIRRSRKAMEQKEVVIQTSSGGASLDKVISAQRAVSQLEGILRTLNIGMLKLLAVIKSDEPKARIVPVGLLLVALVLVMVPLNYVLFTLHLGLFAFTLRDKTTENRLVRRLRENWHSIAPVPVRMIEPDTDKKNDE